MKVKDDQEYLTSRESMMKALKGETVCVFNRE